MAVKFMIGDSVSCLTAAITDAKTRLQNLPGTESEIGLTAMFPQLWDTPMLGFLGVAAAADTVAYTTIVTDVVSKKSCVYFDGTYAYTVYEPNDDFLAAIQAFQVGGVLYASSYERGYEEFQHPEE